MQVLHGAKTCPSCVYLSILIYKYLAIYTDRYLIGNKTIPVLHTPNTLILFPFYRQQLRRYNLCQYQDL